LKLEPASPSPCATSIESTFAASSAFAIRTASRTEYWWRTAWLPSRNVTSEIVSFLFRESIG